MSSAVTAVVIGGALAADSAENAEDKQYAASQQQQKLGREGMQISKEQAAVARSDLSPWRNHGKLALESMRNDNQFMSDYAIAEADVKKHLDPSMDFRIGEGVKALDASALARGSNFSGAQAKALNRFAQNTASQEYGNAFARAEAEKSREMTERGNRFNRLATRSNQGQNAAALSGSQAIQSANQQIGSLNTVGKAVGAQGANQAQQLANQNQIIQSGLSQGATIKSAYDANGGSF